MTPIINTPFTIETVSFKSNKTGETIALSEYIKELNHEIKENSIKMLDRKICYISCIKLWKTSARGGTRTSKQ